VLDPIGSVLIIDDDPATRELIARNVAREGFHIETAASGEEGLSLARSLHPDVITLDVMMGGQDGWSVLAALKADTTLANTPVVMVTIVDDKVTGFALGATEYLTKPVDYRHLASRLHKYRRDVRRLPTGRILIVEDDDTTRTLIQEALAQTGWFIIETTSGQTALEHVAEFTPDLILLDMTTTEADMVQFINSVRTVHAWQAIPIIVMTEQQLTLEQHQQLTGSIEGVIKKDIHNPDELLRQVRHLVLLHTRHQRDGFQQ
jgi:hypothetical protein